MTTNKPEVVAYLHINKENPEHRGVSLFHDPSCTNTLIQSEPLIRLSDYEALQAECEQLRKDAELVEALEAIGRMSYADHSLVNAVLVARAALAAHRKGGEV